MDRNEKLLLLQLILEDIRGNWGWDVSKRLHAALGLAQELTLPEHIERIQLGLKDLQVGDFDGRWFRTSWDDGGYIDCEKVHGLTSTIVGRSKAFQDRACGILTYPQSCFVDWDAFEDTE